jgi:hypothetical protein
LVSELKKYAIKKTLQRFALRTQFPPFIWLYKELYEAVVCLCTYFFKRINGTRSFYLRRGLAANRPVYGLSDIDLLVVVDGIKYPDAASQASHHYELLRRFFPMLAENELGIYNTGQLQNLYKYSPFYRHRLDQGKREWKRLFGKDIFAELIPESDLEDDAAKQELAAAWNYLSLELLPGDNRPDYLRKYTAYKWLAETAKAALAVQEKASGLSFETALNRAAEAFPEISGTLKPISRYRKKLLSVQPFAADDVLKAYFYLAQIALSVKNHEPRFRNRLKILPVASAIMDWELLAAQIRSIREFCQDHEWIERAVVVPRLNFEPMAEIGLNPELLAGATVDAYDLVLMGMELPSARMLRDFNRWMERFRPWIHPYFCNNEIAVSLQTVPGCPVKDPQTHPEFFAELAGAKAVEGKLEIAESVEIDILSEHPDVFGRRASFLLSCFQNRDIYRLSVREFFALFWETCRAVLLVSQSSKPVMEIPVTSRQILDAIAELTPRAEAELRQLHREYMKDAGREFSDTARCFNWAVQYIRMLEEWLSESSRPIMELPARLHENLTISVVVITRNRSELLHRALASLTEQKRSPDQVVVVDNASNENIGPVVHSFVNRLNVAFVREENVGIPYARNAGLNQCSGDIVAFLDSDCRADPCWLAELERPFLKNPFIGAVGGDTLPLNQQGELVARFLSSRMQTAPITRVPD